MALPDEYWSSFETTTPTLTAFLQAVQMISAYQAATGVRFVWRGAADADWGLHSSLFRAYERKHGSQPTERALRAFELEVINEARRWTLDWHREGGRLTALELLAALQHYGVPTRMIDFTYNPLIALWFAVEQHDDRDGRVFAIDISDRLVGRDQASQVDPWWFELDPGSTSSWATESWVWKPPPFEARIVRQEGCFLMGGVPSTVPWRAVRFGGGWRPLHAAEIRTCMSLPFRLIGYEQAVAASRGERVIGATPQARAFTLRVTGKAALRADLERAFSYSHESLFPDFPGHAQYGRSFR
jgi:FRG domain